MNSQLVGVAAATLLTAVAGLSACNAKQPSDQVRAREIMAAVKTKAPDAVFGKVWANGSYTCGRFTTSGGAEKGFLGETVDVLWIEGPDTEPYYGRAWGKFCAAEKPALF